MGGRERDGQLWIRSHRGNCFVHRPNFFKQPQKRASPGYLIQGPCQPGLRASRRVRPSPLPAPVQGAVHFSGSLQISSGELRFLFFPPPFPIAPPLSDSRGGTRGQKPKLLRHTPSQTRSPRYLESLERPSCSHSHVAPSWELSFPRGPSPKMPSPSDPGPGELVCRHTELDAHYLKGQKETGCAETQAGT